MISYHLAELHCKFLSAGTMCPYVFARLSVHLWYSGNKKLLHRTAGNSSVYLTEVHTGSCVVSIKRNTDKNANCLNRSIPGEIPKSVVQK